MTVALLLAQLLAFGVLLTRLASGRVRRPPVEPRPEAVGSGDVTVLLPTLNEGRRIQRCLDGLRQQGSALREVIVIDSGSTDDTVPLVDRAAATDGRMRVVNDPPLPSGWIGKVWALQHGLGVASTEWVLGVDADTAPVPGMVAGALEAALRNGYDVVSFSPRFAGMSGAEQWLQPSMLLTLVYRFGAVGMTDPPPDRVMANGQCFLARRATLLAHDGYTLARASWADDVSLARALAHRGVRVGFMDGSRLYDVRAYDGVRQMWREWGRSFDLSDATTPLRQAVDVAFILLVQAGPWLLLLLWALGVLTLDGWAGPWLLRVNLALAAVRVLMLGALRPSYAQTSLGFWLSPLSDPLAAWRLLLSSLRRPRSWRGRQY